ncbi:MAG: hypothetical protein WCY30_02330 [Candidatus Neomarinimicrobiota bacterium]|jgi:hypothetical protein
MNEQISLFENREKPMEINSKYTIQYIEDMISNEPYLWDMRCWHKYGDDVEMAKVIASIVRSGNRSLNCGHVMLLIKYAIVVHHIPISIIKAWMLQNKNIQYKYRIVPCMIDGVVCSKYLKNGRYGGGMCDECEKTKEQIEKERIEKAKKLTDLIIETLGRYSDGVINVESVVINGTTYDIVKKDKK